VIFLISNAKGADSFRFAPFFYPHFKDCSGVSRFWVGIDT
jgi:hypothetical protein